MQSRFFEQHPADVGPEIARATGGELRRRQGKICKRFPIYT